MNRLFRLPVFIPQRRRTSLGLVALVLQVAGLLLASAQAAEPSRRLFDIPAGAAEITLRAFAEQAAGQFLFSGDKVAGVRTQAVKGELAPREALERLVAGTELRVVQDRGTGALTVDRVAAVATAGASSTGSIEGRIFNERTGSYLNNARVVIEAQRLETFTDEYGRYSFPRVAAGEARVQAFYTGFPAETLTVNVTTGRRVEADFNLRSAKDAAGDATVQLDAFTVAAKRDMAASDVAVNEQRFAAEIKNIVSTDSFGDIADGNVGEFAKYMPGVTLNRSGSDGLTMSIGGVPPGGTPIMLDGNGIASATGSNANRQVEFENIAVGSLARVEVSRSQNPDSPANAIGGSVNLISRSAFERSRPQYTIRSHLSFRGDDFSLSKEPNPFAKKDYVFEPNLELSAVVPLSRNFGFAASGLASRTRNNGPGITQDWVPTVAAQSANFPATTPDLPYLARYRLQERPKITVRDSLSLSADWRVSPADVLTFGFQYFYHSQKFWVRQLNFDTGRVASFGRDFTQGVAGAGFVQILTDAREKNNTSFAPSFRYKHNGPVWQWQVGGAYSGATNHYSNKGYFLGNNAFFRNVTVRFQGLTEDHPSIVSVKDAAGVRDVDPYSLANYNLESVSGQTFSSAAAVRTLNAFLKRDFNFVVPLTVKTGADIRTESRDLQRPTYGSNFVGADRTARTPDDSAAQWFDPIYSQRELKFGPKMQWFDLNKIGETYRAHPEYFTSTEAEAVTAYRSQVTTSQAITETILAPYLRLDAGFLNGRLQVTGGVRYERTEDDGNGPLIDPTRIYQRNASGQIVRDSAGRPVVVAPLATLAGTKLAYIERGASTNTTYDDFFPSVNGSFKIRPDLIARASYGRSFNRPDFGNILPSMNLPDTESTNRTITLTNPGLKPWFADSYGLALEYYFNEPSTGVVSVRGYRRDITDFWGTTLRPASDDLLEPFGIDPDVYGQALGYQVSTTSNVGDARVTGAEFDYRQNLVFLPHWARGFTVFGNLTLQRRTGSQTASFSGFVRKTFNYGVTFSRERFTARVAVNLRGEIEQGRVTTAGAEPNTITYLQSRAIADVSAEYRLTRKISVFVTGRNVNSANEDTVTYGPSTPSDRIIRGRINYGATWYVGFKGTY
ncbi:TonB-dependent receptor domain-containing protein [Horticoccus sp. 23ND18S-11]|uniref:TonB-dependent receptor domain-containing protein n=1 Tax=Horticoccus sp. 23ND18S-11 TaxID=3391832 RepID=UPI0039C951CA